MKRNDNDILKKKIKEERQRLGINQAQLAEKAGVTPAAISQIEKGLRTPTMPVLKRIAEVLGVSIDYLSGNTSRPELHDLLQNEQVQAFYRGFQSLQPEDKKTILKNIEFLKEKYKSEQKK